MTEEEHKGLQAKVESLESIVRMLELKAKNATDHGMNFSKFFTSLIENLY